MNNILMALTVAIVSNPIGSALMDIELVKDYACYITSDRKVIVALLTEPIFTSSQRARLVDNVCQNIKDAGYLGDIYITFDTDIYLKLNKITDDKCAEEIISIIKDRQK